MEEYDQADLEMTLTDVAEEIDKLPRRHTDLLNLFQDIRNKQDEEQYEQKLADDALREQFYECLRDYSRSLAIGSRPRVSWSRRKTQEWRGIGGTWHSS
jgi:type I restriction enzyme, R subunit